MTKKTALIFGISGQDGSYLARLLIKEGYRVCGTTRNSPESNLNNLSKLQILQDVEICTLNLNNQNDIHNILNSAQPDEVYNLTGPSSVAASFIDPEQTYQMVFGNTLNCLDAIKDVNRSTKYYNACSSECFGNTGDVAANEMTPFQPLSPYAAAKAAAYWLSQEYRSAYGLFISSGILFNHESPLRNSSFVTQKIIQGAKDIVTKKQPYLKLGNLDVRRDWGWGPDYVEGMHKIMNHDTPEDFVLATGKSHSLTQFLELTFQHFDLDWREHVRESSYYIRESDVTSSLGDPSKAESILGWSSTSSLSDIIKRMIDAT